MIFLSVRYWPCAHHDQTRFHSSLTSSFLLGSQLKNIKLNFLRRAQSPGREDSHAQWTVAKMPNSPSASSFFPVCMIKSRVNMLVWPFDHILLPTIVDPPCAPLTVFYLQFLPPPFSSNYCKSLLTWKNSARAWCNERKWALDSGRKKIKYVLHSF